MTKKQKKNVLKYRKSRFPNVGIVIFFIIFVYVLLYTIAYINRDKTSIYTVVSETKSNIISRQGLIIRKEKVFRTADAGYINYYASNNARVKNKNVIYTIDTTGSIYTKLISTNEKNEEVDGISNLVNQFKIAEGESLSDAYRLKEDIEADILSSSSRLITTSIEGLMSEYGKNEFFHINYSNESGIVNYIIDGFEDISLQNLTGDVFESSIEDTNKTKVKDAKVEVGDPIYKLISDEEWQVVLPIDEIEKGFLKDRNYIDVTIDNSNFTARAKLEILEIESSSYLVLTFYNYMVNYANKRFVYIYITLDNVTGLKIPKSSLTNREVYEIPTEYLMSGSGSNSLGFTRQKIEKNGDISTEHIETDISYWDREKNLVYIDVNDELAIGDELIGENKAMKYVVAKKRLLTGVYNVNKGYPRFKYVVPSEDDKDSDYYLIPTDKGYYIYEYDNIVLNADKLDG